MYTQVSPTAHPSPTKRAENSVYTDGMVVRVLAFSSQLDIFF